MLSIKRREFITLLGGATAWPIAARAQQPPKMRRIGILLPLTADDPEDQARLAAFLQGLEGSGWSVGRNLRIDMRWGGGDVERIRKFASELVALAPDLILTVGVTPLVSLQQASRSVPIIFVAVTDPVGGGFVESLARPGGNLTGFAIGEYETSAKWLELLKEIAPRVTRAAVLRDASPSGIGQFAAIQASARSFGIDISSLIVQNASDIERAIAGLARVSNAGMIVVGNAATVFNRNLIAELAAKHRLPAVYAIRLFVTAGGLLSYGPDIVDQCRRGASYAASIVNGEQPANLPVQLPTKFELVINLKTAKALDLIVPPTLLSIADEVIE